MEAGERQGTVLPLRNPVRHYAWGSRHVLAQLQGRPAPTTEPEAELWVGAHPSAPSSALTSAGLSPLTDLVAADPDGVLGPEVARRFGDRLPYLLKILAIDAPLSLQAHPSAAQAAAGFHDEERRGIPVDAPQRCYRDPWPKPELLCALTPVTALCGLRPASDSLELLSALDVADLAPVTDDLRTRGDAALPDVLRALLTWPPPRRSHLVTALGDAAARVHTGGGPFAEEARWLSRLAADHPADPGVAVAALLHLVHLEPGDAIHLPAGELHAYLDGTGVEVMACSDNVLRGGLTVKHVDVDGLLAVLSGVPTDPPRVAPIPGVPGEVVYDCATEHFRLSRLHLAGDGEVRLDDRGAQLLLVTDGEVTVGSGRDEVPLGPGEAVLVTATASPVRLAGRGTAFRTTVGDEALAGRG